MVNNNGKKGEKSTNRISFQVNESNWKEAEDLLKAVLNMYIPLSLTYSLIFHLPLFNSIDKIFLCIIVLEVICSLCSHYIKTRLRL